MSQDKVHLRCACWHDLLLNIWYTLVVLTGKVQYPRAQVQLGLKRVLSLRHLRPMLLSQFVLTESSFRTLCGHLATCSKQMQVAVGIQLHKPLNCNNICEEYLSGMATFSSMSDMSCRAAPCIRLMSQLGTVSPWPVADCLRVLMRSLRDRSRSTVSSTRISGGNRCETSCRTCCCMLVSLPAHQQHHKPLMQGVAVHISPCRTYMVPHCCAVQQACGADEKVIV